jgi:hypothetical protein
VLSVRFMTDPYDFIIVSMHLMYHGLYLCLALSSVPKL